MHAQAFENLFRNYWATQLHVSFNDTAAEFELVEILSSRRARQLSTDGVRYAGAPAIDTTPSVPLLKMSPSRMQQFSL